MISLIKRTPKRLKKDNFNFEDYLRRAAELDIKYGKYDRNDYIGSQEIYIMRRNELLQQVKGKADE